MIASIIIPVKNGGELFKKVLKTTLEQNFKDFEVIVIDSGSKDGSLEYVKSLQHEYPHLILKQIEPKDFGHGKTRNYGAKLAKGDFLIFITHDALPYDENWLKEMIKPFELNEEIVGVFARHLPYQECDIFEKENLRRHFENFGQNIVLYKIEDKKDMKQMKDIDIYFVYSDNASAMRKSIWETVPYDDVDFAEDQLWAKKILELGYTKAYNSKAIVYHSHNYGFKELLKRSYDDHKGLYKIYCYVPVKSIFLLPLHIAKGIYGDLYFLKKQNNIQKIEKLKWLGFSIRKNIAKYIGAYLGPKNFANFFNAIISREYVLRNK